MLRVCLCRATGSTAIGWHPWIFPDLQPGRLGSSAGWLFENGAARPFPDRRLSSSSFSNSAMRASRVASASVSSPTRLRDEQRPSASWRTLPRHCSERGRASEFLTVRAVPARWWTPLSKYTLLAWEIDRPVRVASVRRSVASGGIFLLWSADP